MGIAQDTLRALDIPKPPTYDGTGNFYILDQFLFAMETYLGMGNIQKPTLQVYVASGFLTGLAAMWFQANQQLTETKDRVKDWKTFKQGLFDNFAPANLVINARNQLAECTQTSTVREYLNRFRSLTLIIKDLSNAEIFDKFTRGLKPWIKTELLVREVDNFIDAVRVAEKLETAKQMSQPNQGIPKPPIPQGKGIRLNAFSGPRPRMTQAERDDCVRRGACFYCREEGHTAFECPNRKGTPGMEQGKDEGQ